ncbi:MAG: nuclear transport factor 2 family protein [Candidatus Binataceae bacterium]
MSAEENKKVVMGLFESMNAGKADAVMGALADSATWWVAGNFPLSGIKTKTQFGELIAGLGSQIDGALKLTPLGVTAEGDRVAVEAESMAKLRNGRTYNNKYHFLFIVRNGKIQEVKEYMDTMHANQVLCA